jgi:hypothetical protein
LASRLPACGGVTPPPPPRGGDPVGSVALQLNPPVTGCLALRAHSDARDVNAQFQIRQGVDETHTLTGLPLTDISVSGQIFSGPTCDGTPLFIASPVDVTLSIAAPAATVTLRFEGNGHITVDGAFPDTPTCVAAPAGALAWWPADGDSPADIAGSNPGLFPAASYADGKVGRAFSFDGASELTVADAPALDPSTLTIEAWARPTVADGGVDIIVNKETSGVELIGYEIGIRGTGQSGMGTIPVGDFAFFLGGVAGLPNEYNGWVDSRATAPLDVWTHIAVTYDGAAATFYVNGAATRTIGGLSGAVANAAGPLKLGGRSAVVTGPFPQERFNGRLDEVTIYGRALGADEIGAIFAAGSAGKCKS